MSLVLPAGLHDPRGFSGSGDWKMGDFSVNQATVRGISQMKQRNYRKTDCETRDTLQCAARSVAHRGNGPRVGTVAKFKTKRDRRVVIRL